MTARVQVSRRLSVLAFLLALFMPALAAQPRERQPLSVMTFNIRYATDRDGDDRWTARRGMLFELLRKESPDIIGLQEALDAQLSDILEAVPGYAVVGVGRDDGRSEGEYSAVLFKRGRFRVAATGTFWFSDTPEVVASRTWGNRITRICTWARFVDSDGAAFWVYNVHLDHESQPSRERSTQLLVERIRSRPAPDEPVIVTGDFNVGEDNVAVATVRDAGFVDTFRKVHPNEKEVGTFTAFRYGQTTGPKIDYVFVQPDAEVTTASILRFSRNSRYPSDHFPVTATIRLR